MTEHQTRPGATGATGGPPTDPGSVDPAPGVPAVPSAFGSAPGGALSGTGSATLGTGAGAEPGTTTGALAVPVVPSRRSLRGKPPVSTAAIPVVPRPGLSGPASSGPAEPPAAGPAGLAAATPVATPGLAMPVADGTAASGTAPAPTPVGGTAAPSVAGPASGGGAVTASSGSAAAPAAGPQPVPHAWHPVTDPTPVVGAGSRPRWQPVTGELPVVPSGAPTNGVGGLAGGAVTGTPAAAAFPVTGAPGAGTGTGESHPTGAPGTGAAAAATWPGGVAAAGAAGSDGLPSTTTAGGAGTAAFPAVGSAAAPGSVGFAATEAIPSASARLSATLPAGVAQPATGEDTAASGFLGAGDDPTTAGGEDPAGEPVDSSTPGRSRRALWITLIVVGVLMLVGGGAGAWYLMNRDQPAAQPEVVVAPSPTADLPAVDRTASSAFAANLPATVLQYALASSEDDPEWVAAGALEAYADVYADSAGEQVTVRSGQWATAEEATAQQAALAEGLTGEVLESGPVSVAGEQTGAVTIVDRGDGTGTAVWSNGTGVFQLTALIADVRNAFAAFPV